MRNTPGTRIDRAFLNARSQPAGARNPRPFFPKPCDPILSSKKQLPVGSLVFVAPNGRLGIVLVAFEVGRRRSRRGPRVDCRAAALKVAVERRKGSF
jgi:hypothetical protein